MTLFFGGLTTNPSDELHSLQKNYLFFYGCYKQPNYVSDFDWSEVTINN